MGGWRGDAPSTPLFLFLEERGVVGVVGGRREGEEEEEEEGDGVRGSRGERGEVMERVGSDPS